MSAARAVVDAAGEIAELHVVAAEDRSPKLVVRDIQSVARAVFDVEIDYRRVSVVQLPPHAEPPVAESPVAGSHPPAERAESRPAPEPAEPRPAAEPYLTVVEDPEEDPAHDGRPARLIPSLSVEPSVARVLIAQSGALTEITVELAGPVSSGSATVRGPSSQVPMLAARAALAARETLGAVDAAAVTGVEEAVVAGRRVVIVAAIVAGPAGEAFATACAPVSGSVAEAAAAAALQAVAGQVG